MNARRRFGFTLVEIMIVVAIIGLLAALALPGFAKARNLALNNRFVNDLRIASNAFDTQAALAGDYPPDGVPGVMPAGMAEYLTKMRWTQNTPIGGQWDWDFRQFGVRAGVSVYTPARTVAQMVEIDRIVDDGNLGTGIFRQRSGGYIYILQE